MGRHTVSMRPLAPLESFQEALLRITEADPECMTRPEWWETDYRRLVLEHMHGLNQSPISTLRMVQDGLRTARLLRGKPGLARVTKAEREEAQLGKIFMGLGLE